MKMTRRWLLLCWLVGSLLTLGPPGRALDIHEHRQFAPLLPIAPAFPIAALHLQVAGTERVGLPLGSTGVAVESIPKVPEIGCDYLVTVADDFIVEVYRNGKRVPDAQRQLLAEIFGATVEKIQVAVHEGDWLVFHVVQDRLRWGGSKYFAVAGCLAENRFGFVSDPASGAWSACDDPAKVSDFISRRDAGRNNRARVIDVPWGGGDENIKLYAGKDFPGKGLWGGAPSTWIKFIAVGPATIEANPGPDGAGESVALPKSAQPRRWPVQVVSAIYGISGKDADVTEKVREHVEKWHHKFSVNPTDLGADPDPYWNKRLHIIYMKDGVRREQWRNENEDILLESFYCPQDAGELRTWLPETRWFGEQPDIQFHADQTFTSPGIPGTHRWEATGPAALRLTWDGGRVVNCKFDYTWSSFSEAGNARNVFHLSK